MNIRIRKALFGLMSGLLLLAAATPSAFADGVAQAVDTLEGQVTALQTENATLKGVIMSLTAIVDGIVDELRGYRPHTLTA